MVHPRRVFTTIISGFLILTLAGCMQTVNPTPTPSNSATPTAPAVKNPSPKPTKTPQVTPTPTPTKTPEPVAEKIILAWNEIRLVTSEDVTVNTISYDSSPQDFIDTLTPVYGMEPTSEYIGEGDICWANITTVSWEGLNFSFIGKDFTNGELIWFNSSHNDTPDNVIVSAPNGASTGQKYQQYIEKEPNPLLISRFDYDNVEYFSWLADKNPDLNPVTQDDLMSMDLVGTVINGSEGLITHVTAPHYFVGDC